MMNGYTLGGWGEGVGEQHCYFFFFTSFLIGVQSLRKEFAPFGANSFL